MADARTALTDAKSDAAAKQNVYDAALEQQMSANEALASAKEAAAEATPEALASAQQKADEAQAAATESAENLSQAEAELKDAQANANAAKAASEQAQGNLTAAKTAKANVDEAVATATTKLNSAKQRARSRSDRGRDGLPRLQQGHPPSEGPPEARRENCHEPQEDPAQVRHVAKAQKRKPYRPIGADGQPKVADNVVNRDFRRGEALKVISTDITYLPSAEGFTYFSGIIDCETNVLLSHVASESLEEAFVLETYDGLKGLDLPDDIWACSDQGVHYTARPYRGKLAELGINQSMSRKACCWGNAPIESFWGVMKRDIGPTGG